MKDWGLRQIKQKIFISTSEIRNEMIINDVKASISLGQTPVILTRYKDHAKLLYDRLKDFADHVYLLYGGNSDKQNAEIRMNLKETSADESLILIATGQKIGEGFDFPRLDVLMLAAPVSFDGRLEQYIGRLNRDYKGKEAVYVYDYIDSHVRYFDHMYAKRLRTYKRTRFSLWTGEIHAKQMINAIYDSGNYSEKFEQDIVEADQSVIISSPDIRQDKIERLLYLIKSRQEAGVQITVITTEPESAIYGNADVLYGLIDMMKNAGITVQIKEEVEERFAVIDQGLVWHGGVNLLGKEDMWDNLMRIKNAQVDGYSLDAQRDKLKKYADYQEMTIAGEYSDEGKSGKSVEGRLQFMQMLRDIEESKDDVDFVLVFKLSRFGRNAADVLSSLQRMQDFGVNLICVEDGIDSSKDAGKLMISVLSAVAEIERENILVQTMEGRKQKAREGKWNGGFAPYGYKLENGELIIAEDEADIIRLIYDKYINTTMGINAIAAYLNQNGYRKKKRQNNTLDTFASSFIKGVLDNPIYCGKLAFGRRKNEKKAGTRNDYHVVKQENYMLNDGAHEGIISEADWNLAKAKREKTSVSHEKVHSLEHEHILSGIVKCPICGSGMYGNVNRKKRKDGTLYKDYFYYACKHRRIVDGHSCTYRKQWGEDRVNDAVAEIIRKLVQNPKLEEEIKRKIGKRIATDELDKELDNMRKQMKQLVGAKNKLADQIDSLDIMDKHYDRKYQDMQNRMDKFYDEISALEDSIAEVENRMLSIRQQKISGDNVYEFLLLFDKLYDRFSDAEKKEFLKSFVERVDLYEEEQPDGRFLKHIKFRFPVFYNGIETEELCWDNESTVETVACLQRLNLPDRIIGKQCD